MAKLKKFRLNKRNWLRGNSINYLNAAGSALYDRRSMSFCCLGQLCRKEFEIPSTVMNRVGTPDQLDYDEGYDNSRLSDKIIRLRNSNLMSSELIDEIISVNDSTSTDDKTKIAELTPLFAKLGYELEVVW